MPIYEYVCRSCRHAFEELVSGKNEAVHCPECGAGEVDKAFSTFGVGSSQSSGTACGLPEAPPGCGQGACPSCMD